MKPITAFAKNRSRKLGIHNECKECQVEYNRVWFAQKNYSLTKEQAVDIIEKIRTGTAMCEICGEILSLVKAGYAIDHSHSTGAVRGLLCTACNKSLGGFREDLYILEKAKKYIEKYDTRN